MGKSYLWAAPVGLYVPCRLAALKAGSLEEAHDLLVRSIQAKPTYVTPGSHATDFSCHVHHNHDHDHCTSP
jgi:hypothetical protein